MKFFGGKEGLPNREASGLETAITLASVAFHVSRFWGSKQEDIRRIGEEMGEDFKRQPGKLLTILESAAAAFDETVLDYEIEQAEERLGIEDKRTARLGSIEEKREKLEELVRRELEQSSI